MEQKKHRRKKRLWLIPAIIIVVLFGCFFLYVGMYYHADATAISALESDEAVTVTHTDFGWLFDGPSEADALIFYPGAKVEETAYAPLLHYLAGKGMDVCLVKMPFRLAVFGANKANHIMKQYDYEHWYIGGHSLGGTMAADYASERSSELCGVYMLAAYPTKPLDEKTTAIIIYGSEDGILNMKNLTDAKQYLPDGSREHVIKGGNHSQFGNYAKQDGDGIADISFDEQQHKTVELILQNK